MTMARYSGVVQDHAGNIIANAKIEVRLETPGQPLAAIKSDRAGVVSLLNPFDVNADGTFGFYAVGGAYQVRAYVGPSGAPTFESIRRYEGVGLNSEADKAGDVAGDTHAAASKIGPVDADEIPLIDTDASNVLKKLTLAVLRWWLGVVTSSADNIAYNSSMEISQEFGTAGRSIPTGNQALYAIDGYRIDKSGTSQLNAAQIAITDLVGFKNALQVTVAVAQASIGSDGVRLTHLIEGNRLLRAGWGTAAAKPITVGFWFKAPAVGTYQIQLVDSAGAVGTNVVVITATSSGVWQYYTMTFAGMTTGTWGAGSGLGGYFVFHLDVGTQTGHAVANASYVTQFTGLMIVAGSVGLKAESSASLMRTYSEDQRICLRYYWRQAPGAAFSPFASGMNISTTQMLGYMRFPVPMRAAPSVATSSPGNMQVLQGGSGFTITAFALDAPDTFGTNLLVTTSGLTAGAAALVRTINTSGDMVLNARL